MEDTADYIEVPVPQNPYEHEWFMYCANSLQLDVIIKDGFYRVYYEDPAALFELGKTYSRQPNKQNFKCNYGLKADGSSFTGPPE